MTSGVTPAATTSSPTCARPSKPTNETRSRRRPAGPTGQPGCQDRPSCAAETEATEAWNGGRAAMQGGAYSGHRNADARACARPPRLPAANPGDRAELALDDGDGDAARVRPPRRRAVARARRLQRALDAPPGGRRHDATRHLRDRFRPCTGSMRTRACGFAITTWRAATGGTRIRARPPTTPSGTSPAARPLPSGAASEALWRASVAYRELAVIEYNARPAIPGRGSAIFLHDDTGHATNGCVSLPRADLLHTLRWLRPGGTITIAIGPRPA